MNDPVGLTSPVLKKEGSKGKSQKQGDNTPSKNT